MNYTWYRVCARYFQNGLLEPYGTHWNIIIASQPFRFVKKKPIDFCVNVNPLIDNKQSRMIIVLMIVHEPIRSTKKFLYDISFSIMYPQPSNQ